MKSYSTLILLSVAAALSLASGAQAEPYLANATDFFAEAKELGADAMVATLRLGPGENDAVHVLVQKSEKNSGAGKDVLYWATTTGGALGKVDKEKGRSVAVEMRPGGRSRAVQFDLPLLTYKDGDRSIAHDIVLTSVEGLPGQLRILDEVEVRKGAASSKVSLLGRAILAKSAAASAKLWGEPKLNTRIISMSNPPQYSLRLTMGDCVILTGRGTAGPLAITVRKTAKLTEVVQQVALDSRQFKGTQFYAGEVGPFELKNAEPSTDYQVEFNCALGPALGSVSQAATVRTESVINKSKKP